MNREYNDLLDTCLIDLKRFIEAEVAEWGAGANLVQAVASEAADIADGAVPVYNDDLRAMADAADEGLASVCYQYTADELGDVLKAQGLFGLLRMGLNHKLVTDLRGRADDLQREVEQALVNA